MLNILALILNNLISRTGLNEQSLASADDPEPSWCPKPASNLAPLLTRGSAHREARLKVEEKEGALGEERDRGERLTAEPAIAAGCCQPIWEDVNLMGSMNFTKVLICLKMRAAEINYFPTSGKQRAVNISRFRVTTVFSYPASWVPVSTGELEGPPGLSTFTTPALFLPSWRLSNLMHPPWGGTELVFLGSKPPLWGPFSTRWHPEAVGIMKNPALR